jgi:hypothetical protein
MTWKNIAAIREAHENRAHGNHWFEPGAMRFFGTRIESGVIDGRYFVTSEQPPHGPRRFSIRCANDDATIDTVGKFCAFGSLDAALEALEEEAA